MFLNGTVIAIVVVLVVVVIVALVISCYNKLVQLRNKVKNAWSQIDVQLKRRFDMIPNLVETVKGYASHEESIFGEFARARGLYAQASKDGSVEGMAEANKGLSGVLSRLLVVQEQYPELKANSNFQTLMSELTETEDKISYTRQFYNDVALKYNNQVEMFPGNIVASIFKFEVAEYFNVTDEEERKAPKVKF